MMSRIPPFTEGPPALKKKMNEIIAVVNSVSNMTGDGLVQVVRTQAGMTLHINPDRIAPFIPKVGGGGSEVDIAKLYQIESAATGPGIYNCLPVLIDSDEWNIADKWDILDIKQEGEPPVDVTETVEVLNLDEQVNSTIWALFETFAAGDWCEYLPNEKYYRCLVAHCAGGCTPWSPAAWAIGDRCRYLDHAYILENTVKTSGDTTPPTSDADWVLDDDEPTVGNHWTTYWELVTEPALSVGARLLAFKVTDDDGNTRLVGRAFGIDFIKQFFGECS